MKTIKERRKYDNARMKKYLQKLRAIIIEAYGGRCSCCGETEYHFLELNHVNGGGRQEQLNLGGPAAVWRKAKREGYPNIYNLLCANCNRGTHRNGGICPHKSDSIGGNQT